MWIFVRSGLTANVDTERKRLDNVQPHDSVENVKLRIAEALEMNAQRIKVFHRGKLLENGKTVKDYGIKQDETLRVFQDSAGSRLSTPDRAVDPDAMDITPRRTLATVSLVTPSPPPFHGVPPLASDDDSDDNAPDVIPGTRAFSPRAIQFSGPRNTDYDEEEMQILATLGDVICDECLRWPRRPCNRCGCFVCGGKDSPNRTLVCDKCEDYYHLDCLDPPLSRLPADEWFCPKCDSTEGETSNDLEESPIVPMEVEDVPEEGLEKKPGRKPGKNRKTGGKPTTSSVAEKLKTCTIVEPYHFGPIPGVEVGQIWKYRKQCSECGVHRPPMAGISGTPKSGSQSIVISGGYKDDVDNGETFIYSGSGGRETPDGGARIATGQSFDQTLTKSNAALAITMFPNITDPEHLDVHGATAKDWRQSKPVRVVRSSKMKHSKYAPEDGFRYDGIYKLLRYWPEKGQDGFIIYKYEFKRDDPVPPPWTDKGKARIEELGLQMIFPGDWDPVTKKAKSMSTKSMSTKSTSTKSTSTHSATKRKSESTAEGGKRPKVTYQPPEELAELIAADSLNEEAWKRALERSSDAVTFVGAFVDEFGCPVCEEFVYHPVTTGCAHNVCMECLDKSISQFGFKCPCCWEFLVDAEDGKTRYEKWRELGGLKRNEEMVAVLRYFNPEFSDGKRGY